MAVRLCLPDLATSDGVHVRCSEIRPLPVDPDRWQQRIVAGSGRRIEVRGIEREETSSGWPVTLVRSDELDGEGAVIMRRLHAFYVLIDRTCVVSVVGVDVVAVEAQRELLLAAEVDWNTDDLLALAQLWQP